MKKKLLRLLPVAAVLLTASCTDDQYDLSEIDTTSQFTVKDLVVPLNMSPIKLKNIISIEDDGDIKIDKKDSTYYFEKKCKEPFKSKDVKVEKITITKPDDIIQSVTVTLQLSDAIISKWENYPTKTIGDILNSPELQALVDINANTVIFKMDVNEVNKDIKMEAKDIDKNITKINELYFDDLDLNINVNLGDLKDVVDIINITNLKIKMPAGMIMGNTGTGTYTQTSGMLSYNETLAVPSGTPQNIATVKGLDYNIMKGSGAELFDATNHTFKYSKQCNINGTAEITANDLKKTATLDDIKKAKNQTEECSCVVGFSDNIVVNMFSGGIDYTIEDIDIEPVKIENLPEILQETGTSIEIANPQLYLTIDNPFKQNNITAQAGLSITGNSTFPKNPLLLVLDKRSNKKVLSPEDKDHNNSSYDDWVEFPDLGKILTGEKIPETLKIEVTNPILNANDVIDFKLGKDHTGITGTWEFYTKLSLTGDSKIKYTKVWDDWGSEDLDGLTVNKVEVSFNVKKDVALDAESIDFYLMGKNLKGEKAELKNKEKITLTKDEQELVIPMTEGSLRNIYGGKLVINLKGKGGEIYANKTIEVSNLRMKVDGYYEKEF